MITIPKKAHFIYFKGRPFKLLYYLTIKTFHHFNPNYEILLHYDNIDENIWFNKIKHFCTLVKTSPHIYVNNQLVGTKQHQADYTRLKALHEHGGVYLDLDIISIKPLADIEQELLNSGKDTLIGLERENHDNFCNAVIMTTPQSEFIRQWIHEYDTTWGEWGKYEYSYWMGHSTHAPKRIYNKDNSLLHVTTYEKFYPLYWDGIEDYMWGECKVSLDNSYLVHLWETEAEKANLLPKDISFFYKYEDTTFSKFCMPFIREDFPNIDNESKLFEMIDALDETELLRLKEIININYAHKVENLEDGYYPVKVPTKQLPDKHYYRRVAHYKKECTKNDYYIKAFYEGFMEANLKGNMTDFIENSNEVIYNNLAFPFDRMTADGYVAKLDHRPISYWSDELLKFLYTKTQSDFILLSDNDKLKDLLSNTKNKLLIRTLMLTKDWDMVFFSNTDDGKFRIQYNAHILPKNVTDVLVYHRSLFNLYETNNTLDNIYFYTYTIYNPESYIEFNANFRFYKKDFENISQSPFCYLHITDEDDPLLNTYEKEVYLGIPCDRCYGNKFSSYRDYPNVTQNTLFQNQPDLLRDKKHAIIQSEDDLGYIEADTEVLFFIGKKMNDLCLESFRANNGLYCVVVETDYPESICDCCCIHK